MKKTLLTLLAFLGMATAGYADVTDVTFEAVKGSKWEASNNEGADKVCDNNTNTKWCQNGSSTESDSYVIIKASKSIYIQGFVMTTANDNESNPGRTPKEYKIYGSDKQDGTYELIYHQTDDNYIGDKNYTDYTIYCNSTKEYQYFKLHILSSNLSGSTLFQISEFKLLPATVGFTYKGGEKNAFDGTTGAKWEGNPPTSVTLEASEATYLTGYQFTTANDNKNFPGRNPSDWKIEGSNDNETWTEIVAETNNTVMQNVNYTPFTFTLNTPPTQAYKYFKITVTKAQGGNGFFQMGEVALIGTSTAHTWVKGETVEPTCSAKGYTTYTCSDCGATKQGDETAMTDHQNYTNGLCDACGYPEKDWMTTNNGWYEPTDVSHFNWLAATVKQVDATVKIRLTQDVDLTGFAGFGNGSNAVAYKGELNGNGHWLKNLTIDTDAENAGLFGRTEGATIHDLGLTGCSVKTSSPNSGVLAGNMKNSTVNRVAVTSSFAESKDHVGAIAGNTEGTTTISNCLSDADIHSTTYQAGGLVGTTSGLTLTKCLFTGTVKNDNYAVSGLVSLIDSDTKGDTKISYNISAASRLENNSKNGQYPIINVDNKKVTFEHNYIAASMVLQGKDGDNTVTVTNNFDDINGSNGKTIEDATMQVKSFFTTDMDWDMENDWKFIATGKYPILAWMTADTQQKINITDAGYATAVSTESLDFSEVTEIKAYAAQANGSYVHLEQLTEVPAGTAFVVAGSKGDYEIPFAVEALGDMPDNDLKVSDGSVQGGSTVYVLANKASGVGFYITSESITIPANKGYLLVDKSSEAHPFIGFEGDQETAIIGVDAAEQAEGTIYNVAGQRITRLQKGINIVNGKKIMY